MKYVDYKTEKYDKNNPLCAVLLKYISNNPTKGIIANSEEETEYLRSCISAICLDNDEVADKTNPIYENLVNRICMAFESRYIMQSSVPARSHYEHLHLTFPTVRKPKREYELD